MRSLNGSIHTTQTPPPLSFYNTFKEGKEERKEIKHTGIEMKVKRDVDCRSCRKRNKRKMLRKITDKGTRKIGCGSDWVIGPNRYTRKPSQQISSANEPWFWARYAGGLSHDCTNTYVQRCTYVHNRKID
jgi:hypothetical protein